VAETLSFEDVYSAHADSIYRFCLSQVRNPAVAEDLAAETFTSAFSAYARVNPGTDMVRPWLFRIARNVVIDRGRRLARRLRALSLLAARPSPGRSIEEAAQQRAELRAVVAAITELGARDRVLVGLRVGAALPFADIAEVLGISEVAARTATHRALQRVRAAVDIGVEDNR